MGVNMMMACGVTVACVASLGFSCLYLTGTSTVTMTVMSTVWTVHTATLAVVLTCAAWIMHGEDKRRRRDLTSLQLPLHSPKFAATTTTTSTTGVPAAVTVRGQQTRMMAGFVPNTDYNVTGGLSRSERSSRGAGADERVVELAKPMGIILDEDGDGNCYISEIVPGSNAATSGKVKVGDVVVRCSAVFGNDLWSTRGVGLSRVQSAIKVRAGPTCTLALEDSKTVKAKVKQLFTKEREDEVRRREERKQAREIDMAAEIDEERKKAAKGWFGLF